MTNTFLVLAGVVAGLLTGRIVWSFVGMKPESERIRDVLAAPHDAEGFVQLLAQNVLVCEMSSADFAYCVSGYKLKMVVNGFTAQTPVRETLVECIQDVPKFQEQIEALRGVPK